MHWKTLAVLDRVPDGALARTLDPPNRSDDGHMRRQAHHDVRAELGASAQGRRLTTITRPQPHHLVVEIRLEGSTPQRHCVVDVATPQLAQPAGQSYAHATPAGIRRRHSGLHLEPDVLVLAVAARNLVAAIGRGSRRQQQECDEQSWQSRLNLRQPSKHRQPALPARATGHRPTRSPTRNRRPLRPTSAALSGLSVAPSQELSPTTRSRENPDTASVPSVRVGD